MRRYLAAMLAVCAGSTALAETIDVKYRGPVDLAPFTCTDATRSSFIERICYDEPKRYMLIQLNGSWYHYCAIGPDIVTALQAAPSMGTFYNANIRSQGAVRGPFDCRDHDVPNYP